MDDKRETLQLLLERGILTGNICKFVATLGYKEKSRSTIGRIKRGERVSERKVDTLWEKISYNFGINDEALSVIADSIKCAEIYHPKLRNEILKAFITENTPDDTIPGVRETIDQMTRRKEQEPDMFYSMLAYIYIKSEHIFPYTIKGYRALKKELLTLNNRLYSQFQAINAQQFTKDTIANIIAKKDITILELIQELATIIRTYIEPGYLKHINSRTREYLNIKDGTFWIENGKEFRKGCELWYFKVNETFSEGIGAYVVVKLTAQSEHPNSLKLMDNCSKFSLGMKGNNLQMHDLSNGEADDIDSWRLDEKRGLLQFGFYKKSEYNRFGLPFTLEMIGGAGHKEERMKELVKITDNVSKEELESFIQEAVNSNPTKGMEFLSERIVNVQVDFNNVIVTYVSCEEVTVQYHIDRNNTKYLFLKDLTATVSEAACLIRLNEDGDKCIYWAVLDKYIPLKEFTKIETTTHA